MKNIIVFLLLNVSLLSCKKNYTTTVSAVTTVCENTVPAIAGIYKLTKFEVVAYATGQSQDVTATLTSCELSGVYNFRTDNTASYTEMAGCTGNGSGTWSLTEGGILFTSFGNRISNTSIVSWDCIHLVLITHFPSVISNNRYTLTRQ